MEHGKVYAVSTYNAGSEIEHYEEDGAGRLYLYVDSVADFDDDGGSLTVNGVEFDYISAEPEWPRLVVDVSSPTQEQATAVAALIVGDRALLHPPAPETTALVTVGHGVDAIEAEVPHEYKAMLRDGVRDDSTAETVTLEQQGFSWVITDVVGRPGEYIFGDIDGPSAEFGPNGYGLYDVDENGERYDVLERSRQIVEDARARLDEAEGRLDDAFDEISVLPDSDYVDAARQQALDAAAAAETAAKQHADTVAGAAETAAKSHADAEAAQAKADALAEAAQDAQTKADQAKADAEAAAALHAQAVADGAKDDAIAAAAQDAQAKADAAQTAAEQAAQAAATAAAQQAQADAVAQAAIDAQAMADDAEAAAKQHADEVEGRARSRGTDLVTNGTGYLGDNTNFSSFTFDPTDAPTGVAGSFTRDNSGYGWLDELIPVDGGKTYQYTVYARQQVAGIPNTSFYLCIVPVDAAGQVISPAHYRYLAGTTTTLAADLNPGDTTISLTDGSGWGSAGMPVHQRRIIWWDWTDSLGKTWPAETYSRDVSGGDYFPTDGVSGNTITLNAPYSGPARPAGSPLSQGSSGSSYIYLRGKNIAQDDWTRYTDSISGAMEQGAPNSGRTAATMGTGFPPGTALARLGVLPNHSSNGGANGGVQAFAGWSFSDASAAKVTADQAISDAESKSAAAKAHADAVAQAAETAAKAYAVTQADGVSKQFSSTAYPGTTQAPQHSTWYRVNAQGKILSVFTQTAAPKGSTWVARPITSEAIDNLDVGKLTASGATINNAVVNKMALQLANIIKANIENLTVTGDTNLNTAVAERIAANTAEFMEITASQVLAGDISAAWKITAGGKIIAGDPAGARVEITQDGVRVFVLGYNGDPYEAVSMVNGALSFAVIGQDGTRLGGIAADGSITGTKGTFSQDLQIMGTPLIGQLGAGPDTIPGWLDLLPRGVIAYNERTTSAGPTASVNGEFRFLNLQATLLKGRRYRVYAQVLAAGNVTGSTVYMAILHGAPAPGGWAPVTAPRMGPNELAIGPALTSGQRVSPSLEGFYEPEVTETLAFTIHILGRNGAKPEALSGVLYVEDVGPAIAHSGGDDGGSVLYETTWIATDSRVYDQSGQPDLSRDGTIETFFWHGDPPEYLSSGWIYGGGAAYADNTTELGRTLPQALTGATIHKVEVYLRNKTYWPEVSHTAVLSALGASSIPATKLIEGTFWVDDLGEGEGRWIEVPVSWFANGANRGIGLGDRDGEAFNRQGVKETPGSGGFHGPNDADPPRLRIRYSR